MSNALSFNPETFEVGGSFEGTFTVVSARFVEGYDFNGKAQPQSGLMLKLVGESGKLFDKFYGIGKSTKFAVINDGKSLQPVEATKGLNSSCKTAILIQELVSAGFDPDTLNSGDISELDGLHAEFANKALKEFLGRDVKTNSGEDAQILVPIEIYLQPGEDDTDDHTRYEVKEDNTKGSSAKGKKTSGQQKAAAKKGGKGKSKGPSEEELADEAAALVMTVLADNGGSIAKAKLTSAAIKAIGNDNANKAALVKLAMSNDFLNSREEFSLDDGEVTLA